MKKKVSSIVLNLVLLVLGVVTVYPFLWMLASSFKKNSEIVALHQTFLPKLFTAGNYVSMNAHFNFMRFFANSIFITLAITVIVIYTSTLCGFVLSKYKFKGRDALFGLVLATMMIPWCVTIIPRYSMIKAFGWMNSYAALIVPASFSGFGIFMMKQHIASVPNEILEAARIDGANTGQVIWHVMRPVVSPGLITVGILIGLQSWNEYLVSSTFLQGEKNFTATLGFLSMNGSYGSNMSILMASSVILIAPIVVFCLCAQRYLVDGMVSGAVKG